MTTKMRTGKYVKTILKHLLQHGMASAKDLELLVGSRVAYDIIDKLYMKGYVHIVAEKWAEINDIQYRYDFLVALTEDGIEVA